MVSSGIRGGGPQSGPTMPTIDVSHRLELQIAEHILLEIKCRIENNYNNFNETIFLLTMRNDMCRSEDTIIS